VHLADSKLPGLILIERADLNFSMQLKSLIKQQACMKLMAKKYPNSRENEN
jgi:hypothetical protein